MSAAPSRSPNAASAAGASHGRGRAAPAEAAGRRLLEVALHLFAEQGYAKTSIRQIAQAAGTNVAAVSYYFGHKAGLYRAVYFACGVPQASEAPATLDELFHRLLAPLRSTVQARAWVQLQRREMFEPSGLWREKVDLGVRPMHDALVAMLCARLGIAAPDDAVQALAVLVIAPAVHLIINCELIEILAPQLLAGDTAVDTWCQRLSHHADLLIDDERRGRGVSSASATSSPVPAPCQQSHPADPAPPSPPRSRA